MTDKQQTQQSEHTTARNMEETTSAKNTQEGIEININDLAAVKSIIDVASQRGAFRANEMEAVGKTYNKIASFLDTITKKE